MSLCKFDFQITLENSFVLVFALAPQPLNSDAGWRASSRTIYHKIILCVIVSLTALQGHSSGTYNLSIKYPHVVDFGLLLKECRHCKPTFCEVSVETS